MAVKDYNVDPDLNTTISGINIAEGCAPSGINNAIRQLMADVKEAGEAQSTKDAEQDAAISAAQSSAEAAQSSADAAQSSADAAQSSADGKVNRTGDFIEWLKFPNGQLFSETDPAIRGMVMEAARGNDTDGYGAMVAPRHALSINNPGGIDLLTRNADGTFGVCGALFKDGRFIWGGAPVPTITKGYTEPVFWHKFSDGLLIQWGQMKANVTRVTFPIPYTIFYALGGGPWYGTRDNVHPYLSYISGMVGFGSKTNTGFTRTGDDAGLGIVRWFLAIGY